jgi:hypothetical protein
MGETVGGTMSGKGRSQVVRVCSLRATCTADLVVIGRPSRAGCPEDNGSLALEAKKVKR